MNIQTAKSPKRIVLIDFFNLFIKNYCANPSMSTNGVQIGGIVGFMKSLRAIIEKTFPDRLYIVLEAGGSQRKRALYDGYKANRRPLKLNRFYEDDIPDSEDNKFAQVITLVKLLKHLPVCQLYVENCEADDVIGYTCKHTFKDDTKIIVSSDRDFYQLIDDSTSMYVTNKRGFIKKDDVLNECGISSTNFCTARSFCGDKSDNISGIPGIGMKTLVKYFPELSSETYTSVDDIIDLASKRAVGSRTKALSNICENADIARLNWRLMYLDMISLSSSQIHKIDYLIDTFEPRLNKIGLLKSLIDEGIRMFDIDHYCFAFNYILVR